MQGALAVVLGWADKWLRIVVVELHRITQSSTKVPLWRPAQLAELCDARRHAAAVLVAVTIELLTSYVDQLGLRRNPPNLFVYFGHQKGQATDGDVIARITNVI